MGSGFMQRLAMIVATGFGLGYSPIVPGTVGSLPGLILAFSLSFVGVPVQLVVAVLLSLMAIPVCSAAEAKFGVKDDRRIVADEYLTFPICMIGLPWNPLLVAAAFVVAVTTAARESMALPLGMRSMICLQLRRSNSAKLDQSSHPIPSLSSLFYFLG